MGCFMYILSSPLPYRIPLHKYGTICLFYYCCALTLFSGFESYEWNWNEYYRTSFFIAINMCAELLENNIYSKSGGTA